MRSEASLAEKVIAAEGYIRRFTLMKANRLFLRLSAPFRVTIPSFPFFCRYLLLWAILGSLLFLENLFYIRDILSSGILLSYKIHSVFALFSHTVLETALLAFLSFLLSRTLSQSVSVFVSVFVFISAAVLTFVDIAVLGIYDFHINSYILSELMQPDFFATSGISLSAVLWLLAFVAAVCVALVMIALRIMARTADERAGSRRVILKRIAIAIAALVVCEKSFLLVNSLSRPAYIFELEKRLPFFYLNSVDAVYTALQQRFKLHDEKEQFSGDADRELQINYPRPVEIKKLKKRYSVIFLIFESTRSDYLSMDTAPVLMNYRRDRIMSLDNYSTSNSTHMGVFGILYGINPYYSAAVKENSIPSFPMQLLRTNGYAAKFYIPTNPQWHRMDRYLTPNFDSLDIFLQGHEEFRDRDIVSRMIEDMKGYGKRPFVLATLFNSSHYQFHFDYTQPKFTPYFDEYFKKTDYLFLDRVKGKLINSYKNSIYYLDSQVGRILSALKAQHKDDSTIVVMTSDHGCEFGETGKYFYSSSLTNYQTRVPMIIILPPSLARYASQCSFVTSNMDIFPTLLALMGYDGDLSNLQGKAVFDRTSADYATVAFQDVFTPKRYAVVGSGGKLLLDFNHLNVVEGCTDLSDRTIKKIADERTMLGYIMKDITEYRREGAVSLNSR